MNLKIIKDTIINDSIIIKDSIYTISHNITLPDNSDNSQLITNGITIFLALTAALIALYQVKSNIISSARITWIENLRDAISNYTVEVSNCATILENTMDEGKGRSDDEIEKILKDNYHLYFVSSSKSNILAHKIYLYLNSQEDDHKEIEILIKKISNHLHKTHLKELNKDEIEVDVEKIISISKRIFKKEWTKSKKLFKI